MPPTPRVEHLTAQAIELHQAGRLGEATACSAEVLTLQPQHPVALTNLGSISFEQKQYDHALQLFDAELQLKPNYLPAIYNIARTYHEQGRWDKAIAKYQACLKRDPTHTQVSKT